MESNTPLPPTGWPYLRSKQGVINIVEVIASVVPVIIFTDVLGFPYNSNVFCTVWGVLSIVYTGIVICLHIGGITRTSKLPWHWIECVSALVIAVMWVIFSTLTLSALTRPYIITAVLGYVTATVYFFDTFEKYKIAITPLPKYAWTTPHMPDLN